MSKIEKLLDKTKRNGETKKWKMYAFAVVGILVIVGGMYGLILFSDVDGYLYKYKETPRLYEFYDKNVGLNETAIYLIGNSMIGWGSFAPLMNDYLDEKDVDAKIYNLYVSVDGPLRRATQIQNIIDSHPSLIVYGITYSDLNRDSWRPERVILVHDELNVREDSLYLFSESQLNDMNTTPSVLWKRTFIGSALSHKDKPYSGEYGGSYDYDIHGRSMDDILNAEPKEVKQKDLDEVLLRESAYWHPLLSSNPTQNTEALKYIVNTLSEENIPVIIILMPLHPAVTEIITNETHQNMYNYLNSLGCPWYDLENRYNESCFKDDHHMSDYGAKFFSLDLADLIIQEMT